MAQAIIKETGETFEIIGQYNLRTYKSELTIDLNIKEENNSFKSKILNKIEYYTLSNGETYEGSDIVVGLDEIRDWKLKNNLNI